MKKRTCLTSGIIIMVTLLLIITLVSSPVGAAQKKLKVGALANLGWSLGVSFQRLLNAAVESYNEKGGLVIKGEKYLIDMILYDNKMNPETARSAIERLVYQDKVKFILGGETVDAWLPVTEANKVLSVVMTPSPAILDPRHKYVFHAGMVHTQAPSMWGWFTKNYPDIKTFHVAGPDNMIGHYLAGQSKRLSEIFGIKQIGATFYPPQTTDFGSIAIKIKRSNPDMFTTAGGGEIADSMLYKAIHEAGFKGQFFTFVPLPVHSMEKIISLKMVEGMIAAVDPLQSDDPQGCARELKEAYIKKYGTWDNPHTPHLETWYCLINGLEKAQSIDPAKVAAVIGSGMKFDSLSGPSMMIPRPDMGNPRTVDMIYAQFVKRIEGGKGKPLDTISIEEALTYNKKFYGWK
jgi:branched-chain amino acid transport system substrate-binding protein